MQVSIDQGGCIGCGLCVSICPAVFGMSGSGVAEVLLAAVPPNEESAATDAQSGCPVAVINLE